MEFVYTSMRIEDYDEIYTLWQSTSGIHLNKADKRDNLNMYLLRNKGQSYICKYENKIIGTIMCGNDGRRAFIYHLAVSSEYRRRGIATKLVHLAIEKQRALGIDKCALFILDNNGSGKEFWIHMGFLPVQEADAMAKDIQ